jgi:hypothetical protein
MRALRRAGLVLCVLCVGKAFALRHLCVCRNGASLGLGMDVDAGGRSSLVSRPMAGSADFLAAAGERVGGEDWPPSGGEGEYGTDVGGSDAGEDFPEYDDAGDGELSGYNSAGSPVDDEIEDLATLLAMNIEVGWRLVWNGMLVWG